MQTSSCKIDDVKLLLVKIHQNLQCPICLDLMKEPVATRCDHQFCRFCMLKLLSRAKGGPAQCPLCKNQVTKRSLQDSPRFKLLVDGLLRTICAYERDTGSDFHIDVRSRQHESSQSSHGKFRKYGPPTRTERSEADGEIPSPTVVTEVVSRKSSIQRKRRILETGGLMYVETDSKVVLFGRKSSNQRLVPGLQHGGVDSAGSARRSERKPQPSEVESSGLQEGRRECAEADSLPTTWADTDQDYVCTLKQSESPYSASGVHDVAGNSDREDLQVTDRRTFSPTTDRKAEPLESTADAEVRVRKSIERVSEWLLNATESPAVSRTEDDNTEKGNDCEASQKPGAQDPRHLLEDEVFGRVYRREKRQNTRLSRTSLPDTKSSAESCSAFNEEEAQTCDQVNSLEYLDDSEKTSILNTSIQTREGEDNVCGEGVSTKKTDARKEALASSLRKMRDTLKSEVKTVRGARKKKSKKYKIISRSSKVVPPLALISRQTSQGGDVDSGTSDGHISYYPSSSPQTVASEGLNEHPGYHIQGAAIDVPNPEKTLGMLGLEQVIPNRSESQQASNEERERDLVDSELDTELLLKEFKSTKRKSFHLEPRPAREPECDENPMTRKVQASGTATLDFVEKLPHVTREETSWPGAAHFPEKCESSAESRPEGELCTSLTPDGLLQHQSPSVGHRKRAVQRLQSSDSGCSEDEVLPSLNDLFGKRNQEMLTPTGKRSDSVPHHPEGGEMQESCKNGCCSSSQDLFSTPPLLKHQQHLVPRGVSQNDIKNDCAEKELECADGKPLKCHSCDKKGSALVDDCSGEEPLNTQQKVKMQQDLLQIELEMAVLEAALKEQSTQDAEGCPSGEKGADPKRNLPQAVEEGGDPCAAVPGIPAPSVAKARLEIVTSGLNRNEMLMVHKFTRKARGTLAPEVTPQTTHVVIQTDAELVCQRTLKYFLGIAGRKWVVSFQWIEESFRRGRRLQESEFEVKGDVVNGRDHGGPRRARTLADGALPLRAYEVSCFGQFSDMTTGQLELMAELCGAKVASVPSLLSRHSGLTPVVVVQLDLQGDGAEDIQALKRKFKVQVVSWEWILDSVSCFSCQQLSDYVL
ncbi:uncharacterized protein LOC114664794 isoform X1 [Erpetoichthys calabaricus]|uniref:uncharacterized protein LOC114664794 isoform X1 n=2 Tax=Erpetoichthys calabaricus TaxID=27687 RepID=UPI002234315A|nr:uncharacterized protein LOC114664794 isoform X1 [Erpetoichthys calabaricus]